MNPIRLAVLAALLAFGAAQADEADVDRKVEMKVIVAGDGHNIDFTSSDMDFDVNDLAVDESRTVTGDSGQDVTFTRTEDGLKLDIEGETVMLPDMNAHGMHMAFVDGGGDMHGDVNVEVMAMDDMHEGVHVVGSHAIQAAPVKGITIISAAELDDSVKESIRSVLISAGHDDEVRFLGGSEAVPHVRVIRKQVDVVE